MWRGLETDIAAATEDIETIAPADAACRRLRAIPGVAPLVAMVLVAAVADDTVGKGEAWRSDYNEVQPHSAIGDTSPISLTNRSAAYCPSLPVVAQ